MPNTYLPRKITESKISENMKKNLEISNVGRSENQQIILSISWEKCSSKEDVEALDYPEHTRKA